MKTITAAIFAVSVGLSLSTVAVAGPFNDRGQDVISNVQSESTAVRSTVTTTNERFTNRGTNYITAAPEGTPAQKPRISQQNKEVHRWNS